MSPEAQQARRPLPRGRQASVKIDKTKTLAWGDGHVYRRIIAGKHKNEDILANAHVMDW